MRNVEYVERVCDICKGTDLEPVLTFTTRARTRSETFVWNIRDVVCRNCGFAFVSPVPTQKSLTDYYTDCYPLWRGETLEFSIENRIAFLKDHIRPGSRPFYVEIGSNATEPFQHALSKLVGKCQTVELNSDCNSDFSSLQSIPPASVDVLAAYFVLEHVPDPGEFLSLCARSLTKEGVLVIEVPNLYIYPVNPGGIIFYEHTNHFSPRSLAALAEKNGLEVAGFSYQNCSRPYGFAAAFTRSRSAHSAQTRTDSSEYQVAKACMTEGANLIRNYYRQLEGVRVRIESAARTDRPIVLWAANRYLVDLLDGWKLPPSAFVVDSDPRKHDYLEQVAVHQPAQVADSIRNAGLIVINSSLHSSEILGQIRSKFGRDLHTDEFLIVEPGFAIHKGAVAAAA